MVKTTINTWQQPAHLCDKVFSSSVHHDRYSSLANRRGLTTDFRGRRNTNSQRESIHSMSARVALVLIICLKIRSTFRIISQTANLTSDVHRTAWVSIYMSWTCQPFRHLSGCLLFPCLPPSRISNVCCCVPSRRQTVYKVTTLIKSMGINYV